MMNLSERKKLAIARDELLEAKIDLENGNSVAAKMHMLSAICFIDMIYTLQAATRMPLTEAIGQG